MTDAQATKSVLRWLRRGELPGAERSIPARVLLVSAAALLIAIWGAVSHPDLLAGYDALSWLLLLVPAFLLAYYRGWRATTKVLAVGTLLLLGVELAAEYALDLPVNWMFLLLVALVILAIGSATAVLSQVLERERQAALVLAYSDPLTGLPNRRLLDFVLDKEFAAAQRGRPVTVVMFEIDGLDRFTAECGGQAADEAVRKVGASLDRQMRLMNLGGRYEGGSFLSILSGETSDGGWVYAERCREAVAELALPNGWKARVSAGVASYELWMRAPADLVAAAWRAARRARGEGGDRVVCESEDERPVGESRSEKMSAEERDAFEEESHWQAVEDAELRFRRLFDGVPVGLYRATEDGEILDANPTLVRMFGYPDRESLLSVSARELYANPSDRDRWRERLRGETTLRGFEVRLRRRDGSLMWGRDTARVVRGRDGVVRYYTGALEDITERKEAEEELRRANEKLRAVFDAAPVAVISMDLEGRVLSWNLAAERIFGWSERESLGRPPRFVPSEKREEFREQLQRIVGGEQVFGADVRRRRKDGAPINLSVFAAPLFDGDGFVTGIMAVMVDVTKRRELEARLAETQRLESIGRLAGGIAHDFNNLLTVILGNCEIVLKDSAKDDPRYADVEDIQAAASHAAALTRQLLAFGRRQILQPKILSLNEAVEEMLDMLSRLIGENIELVTELDRDLAATLADPVEIGQVVMNLAVNARDAMPAGGRLTIRTGNVEFARETCVHGDTIPPGGYVCLTIMDTGVGMDEETVSKIFEPFFTTKQAGEGTGLGLATVYGIVKQSGGYISVESRKGHGTTLRVYLPQLLEAPKWKQAPSEAGRPTRRGWETILLVEDESALRVPMRRGLEHEGYSVLEASNAKQALEICASSRSRIHVMVTDVVMPGMDGLELGRVVTERHPDTKVLYTSGYTEDMVARVGFVEDHDFLQKPYTPSELGAKIREVLDRRPTGASGRAR